MGRLLLLFLTILSVACNKPDPNPELRDGIYLDFKAQLAEAQKNLAGAQKTLEEHKVTLEKVKPQTGQIKYAQKRYWDAQRQIDKYQQQEKYWRIRIQERERFAKKDYLKAFRQGKTWPDPKEYEEYMVQKRLQTIPPQWNAKERIEQYKRSNASAGKASAAGQ